MNALDKARALLANRTTYGAGMLQTRAYRVLKRRTDAALAPAGITSVHWALLGLLASRPDGIRPGDAARELGVEAPFVTGLAAELVRKGYAAKDRDATDRRAWGLSLTPAGREFVDDTEPALRASMRPLLSGASAGDVATYLSVLECIVRNDERAES